MPAYNPDEGSFRRVLRDAIAGSAPGTPIVVVDMSSTDVARRVCAEVGDPVRYDAHPQSGGVSHSRNRCVALSGTRYVAFLDSDGYAEPGWLEPLLGALSEERVAVVGSRILPEWHERPRRLMTTVTARDWLSLLDLGPAPRNVPVVMGTSYAIDRDRTPDPPFDESRGRRPGWALASEEVLLCEQVRAAGWRVVYEPRSVVRHDIPAGRASWRWMWRRAWTAGQEAGIGWQAREGFPHPPLTLADHAFRLAVAPPFLAGRLSARLRPPRRPE